MIAVHTITLTQLKTSKFYPLTRERAVDLAQVLSNAKEGDVRLAITADDHDEELRIALMLATVELGWGEDGDLVLHYVSHPTQSLQITQAIIPVAKDFEAYVVRSRDKSARMTIEPVSAEELEEEGLGPLAVLDLRPENPAPLVPTRADKRFLQVTNGAVIQP